MASMDFMIEGDVAVKVTVTEVDGNLVFNVHVVQPGEMGYTGQIGEVNGIFFDMAGDVDGLTLTAEQDDGTMLSMDVDEGAVSNLGGGVNMNGEVIKEDGKYDVGVLLDKTGIGKNDVQDITFTLDGDSDLSLADVSLQDFGLRLTSVGEPDGPREGSLKLGGVSDEPPVEPPVNINTANNDEISVTEDALFDGLPDFFEFGGPTLLSNDLTSSDGTTSGYAGAVTEVEGVSMASDGIVVAGSNGGLLMVYPDGSVDFSANGEFDELNELQDAVTTFEYTIEGGDTATLTVNVFGLDDGGLEGGGGGEEPGDFLF